MLKNAVLAIVFFLGSISLFGQTNDFPDSGNVGIGTLSPQSKLHVVGSSRWIGNNQDVIEINKTVNGHFLRQSVDNLSTNAWILRSYLIDGFQAEFSLGGLKVNGTIKTKEVNITTTGWADYVFKPEYKLMPLSEVEAFIQMNGHLPDVPTEAEVMENGVNLAEMNVKLLEKVEELTLHIISQENKISSQEKHIESMLNRIEILETKQDK